MKIFAIDPGNVESAFIEWDGCKIGSFGKIENEWIFYEIFKSDSNKIIIEQVASYGMAVGETVFETVFWSGRFAQHAIECKKEFSRMKRIEIKMHHCHNSRAKDTNITQALIDRFAKNTSNKGKGTKKNPGFFYGFKKDIWQAFALAVAWHDKIGGL